MENLESKFNSEMSELLSETSQKVDHEGKENGANSSSLADSKKNSFAPTTDERATVPDNNPKDNSGNSGPAANVNGGDIFDDLANNNKQKESPKKPEDQPPANNTQGKKVASGLAKAAVITPEIISAALASALKGGDYSHYKWDAAMKNDIKELWEAYIETLEEVKGGVALVGAILLTLTAMGVTFMKKPPKPGSPESKKDDPNFVKNAQSIKRANSQQMTVVKTDKSDNEKEADAAKKAEGLNIFSDEIKRGNFQIEDGFYMRDSDGKYVNKNDRKQRPSEFVNSLISKGVTSSKDIKLEINKALFE